MPKINPFQPEYPAGAEPPRTVPGRSGPARQTADTVRGKAARTRQRLSKKAVDKLLAAADLDEPAE